MNRLSVTVPASTSNLGSGFDTLGLAVNLFLCVEAERTEREGIHVEAESPSAVPLVEEAAARWHAKGQGIQLRITNDIPVGRGLGASAALRVAVICAASALAGETLTNDELLQHAYALEHHPDNVSPAIFGGFTVSGAASGQVHCQRFDVDPALRIITLFPDFEMPTGEARKLLPDSYTRADTAHALNRAAMITAAFARRDYAALRGFFDDRLHQPYRERLIPPLTAVIRAGEQAGAIGGFLSGAGSGIICLALENERAIADAMLRAMPNATVQILHPENREIRID